MPDTSHTPDKPKTSLNVTLGWRVTDGLPACVDIRITSPTGAPITPGDLDALNLTKLIRSDRAKMIEEKAGRQGRGPMRRTDVEKLRQVAAVYREAFAAGIPPVVAVEKHFKVKRGTASSWVSRARAAGFLPATTPGAPQG